MLLSLSFPASARHRNYDEQLDIYYNLCSQCLTLKSKVVADGSVSRAEARALVTDFLSLNKELKSRESGMTAAQRRRFTAISQWFATGVPPTDEEACELPQLEADVDVPMMITFSYQTPKELPLQPVQRRKMSRMGNIYILADLAVPDVSYGLMAGYQIGRYGGYAGFRSNFRPVSPSYSCDSDGSLKGGGTIWASGNQMNSNISVCAGVLYGLKQYVSVYAGVGGGGRKLLWEDVEGKWAEVSDCSYKGFATEVGALFSWEKLAFSLGISSISFKTAEVVCGVGVKF